MHSDGKKYWERQGGAFEQFYGQLPWWTPRRWVADFLAARTRAVVSFLSDVSVEASLLDVGCGSGVHLRLFGTRVRSVVGVDVSEDLLARARERCETLPEKNWTLVSAPAERLPFPDRSFSVVLALGLLDYVSDPALVLRECRRVLASEGTLVVSLPKKPSVFSFLRTRPGGWIRRTLFGLPQISQAFSEPAMTALFESAGFRVRDVRSVWGAMWIVKAIPS